MLHGVGCSKQRQCKNKNKGAVYDLNEVMVGANNASWGRLFHTETV